MGSVLCSTWVPGVPRTKGSLDQFHQDSPASKAWRSVVASEVRRYMGAVPRGRAAEYWTEEGAPLTLLPTLASVMPFAGPVAVRCVFVVPPGSDAPSGRLGVGDVDKLARNVLDAISIDARLIADDVQVVRLVCDRVVGEMPGLALTVAALDAADLDNCRAAALREVSGVRR